MNINVSKKYLTAILGILFLAGSLMTYRSFFRYTPSMNSVYLIPGDAVFIISMNKPLSTWDEIKQSKLWKQVKTYPFFKELTRKAEYMDTLITDNRRILDFIGEKDLWISAHITGTHSYDYLFVIDMAEKSNYLHFKSLINNILGKSYQLTERTYHGVEILELLDVTTRETIYFSVIKNNLILSYTHTLVEEAIDQMKEPLIGRNMKFIEVFKKTGHAGMLRLYMQYAYWDDYIKMLSGNQYQWADDIANSLVFSAWDMSLIHDNIIKAEGYTNTNEQYRNFINAFFHSGSGTPSSLSIVPARTRVFTGFNYGNFEQFYHNFIEILKQNPSRYEQYHSGLNKMETYLNIDFQRDFRDWIGDEMTVIYTENLTSNKGDNWLLLIKTQNKRLAKERLGFVLNQIKKKTPVKFKKLTYKEHDIYYMSIKGFFRIFLGGYFSKIEEPYFTFVDDFVVFGNHPNALKYLITRYEEKQTLKKSVHFKKFRKNFSGPSNVFIYVNTPLTLRQNLRKSNGKSHKFLMDNAEYLMSFSQFGLSMTAEDGVFKSQMAIKYYPIEELKYSTEFSESPDGENNGKGGVPPVPDRSEQNHQTLNVQAIHPEKLDADEFVEYYSNGKVKRKVPLKNGLPHGLYREYYLNGELKIKGKYYKGEKTGKWKRYDEKGKLLIKQRY